MRVESGPSKNRVIRLTLMTLITLGLGVWYCYDGWVGYTKQNVTEYKRLAGPEAKGEVVIDPRVTSAGGGLSRADALKQLGDAPFVTLSDHRLYFGPDGHLRVPDASDEKVTWSASAMHNTASIGLQKILGVGLFPVAIIFGIGCLRAKNQSVVIDDSGMQLNGGMTIPFEHMSRLITDRWRDKGWVDVEFEVDGKKRLCRLDSYHLENFDPMLAALCDRKSWQNPRQPKPTA